MEVLRERVTVRVGGGLRVADLVDTRLRESEIDSDAVCSSDGVSDHEGDGLEAVSEAGADKLRVVDTDLDAVPSSDRDSDSVRRASQSGDCKLTTITVNNTMIMLSRPRRVPEGCPNERVRSMSRPYDEVQIRVAESRSGVNCVEEDA
jgi:hypothetical protein